MTAVVLEAGRVINTKAAIMTKLEHGGPATTEKYQAFKSVAMMVFIMAKTTISFPWLWELHNTRSTRLEPSPVYLLATSRRRTWMQTWRQETIFLGGLTRNLPSTMVAGRGDLALGMNVGFITQRS